MLENQNKNSSLISVLWQKVVAYVERKKTVYLFRKAMELIAGLTIGFIIIKPYAVLNFILSIIQYQNFALPKLSLGIAIIFSRKAAFRFFRKIQRKELGLDQEKLIEGIPVAELADYLIRNGNLRREGINGVRATFGIANMEKFNRLASNLERRKILTRGDNNMRVLSGRWSRQALIDFMAQPENENWFRVHRIGEGNKVRLDRKEILSAI